MKRYEGCSDDLNRQQAGNSDITHAPAIVRDGLVDKLAAF